MDAGLGTTMESVLERSGPTGNGGGNGGLPHDGPVGGRKKRGPGAGDGQKAPSDDGKGPGDSTVPPTPRRRKGPSKDDVVRAAVDALGRVPVGMHTVEPFPDEFLVISDDAGVRSVLKKEADDVVRHVADTAVEDSLLAYCHMPSVQTNIPYLLDNAFARRVVSLWKSLAPVLDQDCIEPVREAGGRGLCWQRLPWPLSDGETPVWDELFSRMENAEAVRAWIGSLLDARSARQQYVWLYGGGMNGKGSLIEFLRRVMGPSFRSECPPEYGNRFWTSGLLGSRLVVFPDCNDWKFPVSGVFKSLTGGDAVRVEEKGKPSRTETINAKFMFASQRKPGLSSEIADMRRAIYCELAAIPAGTAVLSAADYGRRLWTEGPHFLWKCKAAWERCAGSGVIEVDLCALEELIEANEEGWDDLFKRNFELVQEPDRSVEVRTFTSPPDFLAVCRIEKLDNQTVRVFKAWMERRKGVRIVRIGERTAEFDGRERRYVGLKVRDEVRAKFARVFDGNDNRF
jgi:hypothetical protein